MENKKLRHWIQMLYFIRLSNITVNLPLSSQIREVTCRHLVKTCLNDRAVQTFTNAGEGR